MLLLSRMVVRSCYPSRPGTSSAVTPAGDLPLCVSRPLALSTDVEAEQHGLSWDLWGIYMSFSMSFSRRSSLASSCLRYESAFPTACSERQLHSSMSIREARAVLTSPDGEGELELRARGGSMNVKRRWKAVRGRERSHSGRRSSKRRRVHRVRRGQGDARHAAASRRRTAQFLFCNA